MRLMILAIDGMDFELTQRWLSRLPNLRRLAEDGCFRPLPSVFPPDSVPAWISFYLGVEPGEHGVLQSIDYVNADRGTMPDVSTFAGNTFWDAAGRAGRRVAVLNAFLAYPVWPVNGVMVSGPVFASGEPQSYPTSVLGGLPAAHLGGFVEFPSSARLPAFARATHEIARRQTAQAEALARQTDWDLFFVTFLTLDRVQHFYWRFHDRTDPTYPTDRTDPSFPREGDLSNVILEHYQLLDETIGRLLNCQPPDCATLVLSDHGHGRRPTRLFHVNEWLRGEGLLEAPLGAANPFSKARLLEFAKRAALEGARQLALEDAAFALAQLIPKGKRQALQRSDFSLGNSASLARRDAFGGNSPSGGIRLNEPALETAGMSVEAVRRSLAHTLARICDPLTGERIAEWVAPREALICGVHADSFPQLLYQLRPNWGTDPSLFGTPFSYSPLHRRLSGGHRPTGVLFASEELAAALPDRVDLPRLGEFVREMHAGTCAPR